jgi:hypothetical protein
MIKYTYKKINKNLWSKHLLGVSIAQDNSNRHIDTSNHKVQQIILDKEKCKDIQATF